ncbi:response regulator [Pseudoalteromonas sp. B193]
MDDSTLTTKNIELPDLSGKIILLAEDNKINQLVAAAMLEPTKATIIIANNGLEAISLYELHKPDIIFMDIQMPKMDGLQACKNWMLNSEQIVIALTANAFTEQKKYTGSYLMVTFQNQSKNMNLSACYRHFA